MAQIKNPAERNFRLVNKNTQQAELDFNKIKVGRDTLSNDVALSIDYLKSKTARRKYKRDDVERALRENDLETLRVLSNEFFRLDGIYSRLCRYMAYLFKYDWFITPVVFDKTIKDDKIVEGWYKAATFLENCSLKRKFGSIALHVIKDGCYYGYKIVQKDRAMLQDLPVNYCRSRYEINGKPAIEFNIKYFDDFISDAQYRIRVLKMFPKEFQKAYVAFKKGTLPRDFQGDAQGWFLLDQDKAVKFNISDSDAPLFAPVIPLLMDLADAQDLDKQKMKQQILKIIIQKMPIDKNGDLIFDVNEAQALHNNAVNMLAEAIGVDVLTTFADVDVADMSDHGNVSSVDQLDKVERTVYNSAGVSQLQFNSDGNIALEKSIANDEGTMSDLICQLEDYTESLLSPYNKNRKRLLYRVQMLPTTVYNYKDISKLYKEQTMIGFSKLLPQVALGQSQSVVIATAYFENKLLHLDELFTPPQMSSTISGKQENNNSSSAGNSKIISQDEGGRPELPDEQKSDKTIQNKESEG